MRVDLNLQLKLQIRHFQLVRGLKSEHQLAGRPYGTRYLGGSHASAPLRVRLRSVALKLTREHVEKVEGSQRRMFLTAFCEQRNISTNSLVSFRATLHRRAL